MRSLLILGSPLVAGLALSACSAGTSIDTMGPSASPFGPAPHQRSTLRGWMSPDAKKRLLYVSLTQLSLVDVYSIPKYSLVGEISDGLQAPEGMATDEKGNLYVTNLTAKTVTVYPKGSTSPSLTLRESNSPVDVAITKKNYVLVGDISGGVDVYPPKATAPSARLTYSDLVQVGGVAVDAHNNVYVAGYTSQSTPIVVEFAHLGPTGANLNLTGLVSPAGVLVDKHGNLAVSDNTLPGVNIYPPGSTSPSATIANAEAPDRSAFDRTENLIYVPESTNDAVNIYDYPSGAFVQTIALPGFVRGAILSPAQEP
jgi:hypothetical protein